VFQEAWGLAATFLRAVAFLCATAPVLPLGAQTVSLDAVRIAGGFDQPLFLTTPPGDTGRLFIVERPGKIRIIKLPRSGR
jgi:hypothetical protein